MPNSSTLKVTSKGTLTVRCTNLANNLSVDKVITINGEAKKAQANTYFLSKNVDGENNVPATPIDSFDVTGDPAKDKDILYLYAKDQYGNNIAANYSDIKAAMTSDAGFASIRPVDGKDNAFKIIGNKADKETTLNIQLVPGLNDKLLSVKLNLKKVTPFVGFTNDLENVKVFGKATKEPTNKITFAQKSSYNDGFMVPFDYPIAGASRVVVTFELTGSVPEGAKFVMSTTNTADNMWSAVTGSARYDKELSLTSGTTYTLTYDVPSGVVPGSFLQVGVNIQYEPDDEVTHPGLADELVLTIKKVDVIA